MHLKLYKCSRVPKSISTWKYISPYAEKFNYLVIKQITNCDDDFAEHLISLTSNMAE